MYFNTFTATFFGDDYSFFKFLHRKLKKKIFKKEYNILCVSIELTSLFVPFLIQLFASLTVKIDRCFVYLRNCSGKSVNGSVKGRGW